MKKYLRKGWHILRDCHLFIYQGFKEKLLKEYLNILLFSLSTHLNKFHFNLHSMTMDKHKQYHTLQKRIKGLHSLLPYSHEYVYSILIDIENPSPKLLHSCLSSACRQTPPSFEILLGHRSTLSPEVSKTIQDIKSQYPEKIRLFNFSDTPLNSDQARPIYNLLAEEARGNYFFFLEKEDWIRPDLLYRYEQFLRTTSTPDQMVVNCHEDQISELDHFIPGSSQKKAPLHFPYIFHPTSALRSTLIPKTMWNKTQGLRKEFSGVQESDLILGLDLAGASFTTIPVCLYSRRKDSKDKTKKDTNKQSDLSVFMLSLKEYSIGKNLNWTFEPGYRKDAVRAVPQNLEPHKIQIITPFKEQKDLTLRCVDSVMKQKGIDFKITAIDNGSEDLSIGRAISELGGEVLRIEEPFNYSRLNNLAVANAKMAHDCDLILFLNNDVELDEEAVLEMMRWIDQPAIGVVGARLHYPNGKLQHGGVRLDKDFLPGQYMWDHPEKFRTFDQMNETKILGVVEAVTAACILIKKEHFLSVGGFDEIWYPIAFSDTSLAVKLNKIGLKSFYTPYAFGVHHESISRKESLEDVDSSRWLHELILK